MRKENAVRGFCLEVSGPLACFTRPEMKVERVSYDVITPSAARAIFEAILWKPAIRWRINKIEVLAPIRWTSVRRNEVGGRASPKSKPILVEEDRQQRAALLLRDVRYRLHAEFDYIPPNKRSAVINPVPEWLIDREEAPRLREDESEAKYAAMFERRAKKGQTFHQPYLGCREFACAFRLIEKGEASVPASDLISDSRDLGWMLYDLDFSDPKDIKPMFFRAGLENGTVYVPHPSSEEVRR